MRSEGSIRQIESRVPWHWLLIILILLSALIELRLVCIHTSWADIQASIPDEAYFIDSARNGFAQFELGYGPVFWGPLELLLKLSPEHWVGLIGRICYVIAKYAAIAIVARTVWQHGSKIAATLFVLAVVASPGYLFFGKIISPEYELLLWTALSVKCLVDDQGQLGNRYLWSIFFAVLATLTKLNGLPLLGILLIYGGVFGYWDGREHKDSRFWVLVLKVSGMLVLLSTILLVVTWPRNLLADIHQAFKIVPPLTLNMEVISFAWRYDDFTWDQIKLGGVHKDFLPTFVLGCLATMLIIPMGLKKTQRSIWVIYLAALAILFLTVFHHMGHTWYLFLPMFLFAAAGALAMTDYGKTLQLIVVVLVLGAAIVSVPRIDGRIDFKLANNNEMSVAGSEARQLVDIALIKYPCVHSANFDILIPWQQEREGFLPLRLALKNKVEGKYQLPDILLVNNKLPSKAHSPLLGYVVKGDLSQFELMLIKDDVSLYVKKSLSCDAE